MNDLSFRIIMESTKFGDMWAIMSKYTLETDAAVSTNDLICLICYKLMIDACQTACGCQFCFKCISDFIGDESKFCPGGKEECNEEYLVIERDVMKNIRMNNRISKLKLKCPNKSCHSTLVLGNMKDHLRICSTGRSNCPYIAIGCDKLLDHDPDDILIHTQLLIEWINNIRNELDDLKEDKLQKVPSNEHNNIDLQQVLEKINEQNEEMINVKKELRNKENRIINLEKESKTKDNQIAQLEERLKEIGIEFESKFMEMTMTVKQREEDIDVQIQQLEIRNDICEKKMKNKLKIKCDKLRNEITLLSEKIVQSGDYNQTPILKPTKTFLGATEVFTWKINNISKVRMKYQTIYSEEFFMNSYKFCISAYLGGNDLGLWCYIMKGKNDKYLTWPMRMTVILSVINQHTLETYRTESYQYDTYKVNYKIAFDRPTGFRNDYSIGSNLFTRYFDVNSVDGIIVNDSMLVSCNVVDLKKSNKDF